MRWNWRDWLAGFAAVWVACAVFLVAVPSGRVLLLSFGGLRTDIPRAEVEEMLGGPGEPSPDYRFYCINVPYGPNSWEKFERMREDIHTEARLYPGPIYTVEVEYAGYNHPRFKSITWIPVLRLHGVIYLLGVALLMAAAAEFSRAARGKLITSL